MQWVDEGTDGHVIAIYFFLPMVLHCARSAYNNCRRDQWQVKMLLLQCCSLLNFRVKKVQTCMIGLRSLHDIHT